MTAAAGPLSGSVRALLRLLGLPARVAVFVGLAAVLGVIATGCGNPAPVAAPAASSTPAPAPAVPAPVRIDVESIDAHSTLVETGVQPDGTLEVPPVEQPQQASWYRQSPRPGEPGPAIVLGHVNGGGRDGVFVDLDQLEAGDRVNITRADGSVAAFDVYRVQTADKDTFPTAEVYGNTPGPELRLITCGGEFVGGDQGYEDNIIVYAREVPA